MFGAIFENSYVRAVAVGIGFMAIMFGLCATNKKKILPKSEHLGNTIYVDPSSELGGMMTNMNRMEENSMIQNAKKDIEGGKITKNQAISGMNNFMSLWGNPPTRDFSTLKEFIKELEKSDEVEVE